MGNGPQARAHLSREVGGGPPRDPAQAWASYTLMTEILGIQRSRRGTSATLVKKPAGKQAAGGDRHTRHFSRPDVITRETIRATPPPAYYKSASKHNDHEQEATIIRWWG